MAYTTLTATDLQAGKAVKADILSQVKTNEDDLNTRMGSVEGGATKVFIVDEVIANAAQWSSSSTFTGLLYYRAKSAFTLTGVVLGQFSAGASGTLEIDILKASDINGTYTSVMNTKPTIASQGSSITIVDYSVLSLVTVTITINGTPNVLTEGTDWSAITSNGATAINLAAAIDLLTGITSSAVVTSAIMDADDSYSIGLTGSDLVNMTFADTDIAGDNVLSTNADIGTTAVSNGEWLRVDISSFQTVQKNFHLDIIGEI